MHLVESDFNPASGADDDGSGSVTILEAYRGLISADFQPLRTVEFHWYSAEVRPSSWHSFLVLGHLSIYLSPSQEGGLLGSQALARDYESRNVNVIAMSQVRLLRHLLGSFC